MNYDQAISLLIISLAVAFLPGVSRILRLPASVVEIMLGVVLGKSFLHLNLGGDWLPFLAHLGFLVLMFLAGMEIDFRLLLRESTSRLIFQFVLFGATFVLALGCSFLLGQGVFMALVLSTTSLGLVMTVLRESRIQSAPLGQTILLASTLADFLTLFGITFFVLWKNYGLSWRFISPLPLFVGFAVLLWGLRLLAWWYPQQAERFLTPDTAGEEGVRLSLALLFLFVGLSELVHLEPVLGAFLGGCIISFVFREKAELESKISAIGYGFLIPLFFIYVGMEFDLGNALQLDRMLFTLGLLAAAIAVKVIPCMLFPLWGMDLKSGLRAGALLSSRLSLIVAAAAIGMQQGFITATLKDSIVLLALISCIAGPTIFKLTHPR